MTNHPRRIRCTIPRGCGLVQRHASAPAGSGSDVGADAVGSRLHAFVGRLLELNGQYHMASKVLNRSSVRFKLMDTEAASWIFHRARTNSQRQLLYLGPTLVVAPRTGTMSSRKRTFLLRRASETRNSFG